MAKLTEAEILADDDLLREAFLDCLRCSRDELRQVISQLRGRKHATHKAQTQAFRFELIGVKLAVAALEQD